MSKNYTYANEYQATQYEDIAVQFKGNSRVEARYIPSSDWVTAGNRLVEALPKFRSPDACFRDFTKFPQWTASVREMEMLQRRQLCSHIKDYRVPRDFLMDIHFKIHELLTECYRSRICTEGQYGNGYLYEPNGEMVHGAFVTGHSGAGKTTAIMHALRYYPRLIVHEMTDSRMLQIPYIYVECPPDASVKAFYDLCIGELEKITGETIQSSHSKSTADYKEKVFRYQAIRFNVGLVIVDEIQNIAGNKKKLLMKHILNLSNELSIPFLFVGTDEAREFVANEEYYITRRIGNTISAGCLNKGKEWDFFLQHLWKYQWTREEIPLTVELNDLFYRESQGNVDRVKELFRRCQEEAIMKRRDTVEGFTVEFVKSVSDKIFGVSKKSLQKMTERNQDVFQVSGEKRDFHQMAEVRESILRNAKAKQKAEQTKYNVVENVAILSCGKYDIQKIEDVYDLMNSENENKENEEGVLTMKVIHYLMEHEVEDIPKVVGGNPMIDRKQVKEKLRKEELPLFTGLNY